MTPSLDHVFENTHGEAKTWDDLRGIVAAYLTGRFPGTPAADIDDAVADAMCDLIDYWVTAPNSLSDDKFRNWNFAIRRAKWTATTALNKTFQRQQKELSLEQPVEKTAGGERPVTIGESLVGRADEPRRVDEERQESIRRFLVETDDEDWENFVLPRVRRQSTRSVARSTGRQPSSVRRSMRRASARLEGRARLCGALM